jgi:hypothetical protein
MYPIENKTRLGSIRSNEYVMSAIKLLRVEIANPSPERALKRWIKPDELATAPETKRRLPASRFSLLFFLK